MFLIFNITVCLFFFCGMLPVYGRIAQARATAPESREITSEEDSSLQKTRARNNHLAAIASIVKTLLIVSIPEAEQTLKNAQAMPTKTPEQQKTRALAIEEAKVQLTILTTQLAALVEKMNTMLRIEEVAKDVEFILDAFGERVAKTLRSISGTFGEQVAKEVEFILNAFGERVAKNVESLSGAFGEEVAENVEIIPDVFGEQVAEDVEFLPGILNP